MSASCLSWCSASARRSPSAFRQSSYWALGILSFALGLYHWVYYEGLILRAGDPNTVDITVGVFVFGEYLPSPLNTRCYEFNQIVDQMFLGTEGIYGIPIYVSSLISSCSSCSAPSSSGPG